MKNGQMQTLDSGVLLCFLYQTWPWKTQNVNTNLKWLDIQYKIQSS